MQPELVASGNKILVAEAERMLAGVPVARPEFAGVKEFRDRVSERARQLGIPAPQSQGGTSGGGLNASGRVRVAPEVQAQKLKSQPKPVYPADAKAARVQGKVVLEVVIGKGGKASSVRLIDGHPLLAPAAEEAVKKWEWAPTLLNGQPVDVVTSVDVEFTPGA
ncbi:MAG: energy transducer TonB [Acidobacteria bacterium]|nr:energy transducer TonB [Acidobacteriota bacterium]